jgi:hypothetical protein
MGERKREGSREIKEEKGEGRFKWERGKRGRQTNK